MAKYTSVDLPPRTRILTNKNNQKYVYFSISSEYQKGKKYSLDKRVLIGKLDPKDPKKLIPNDRYFEIFPNKEKIDECENQQFNFSQNFGHYALFEKIIEDLGLDKIFEEVFGDRAEIIKALAYYFLENKNSKIQHFEKWAFNNYCGLNKVPSQGTISNILNKEIDDKTIAEFNTKWAKHAQSLLHNIKKVFVNLDGTNFNFSSPNIDIAEYGYAKDQENNPIINVVYLNDQHYGLPLFHDVYPGSITDQTQCSMVVEKANNLGFKDLCFVADRGYYSAENLSFIDKKGYKFVCMAKTYIKTIKELINKFKKDVYLNTANYIEDFDVYGIKSKEFVYKAINKKYNTFIFYSAAKSEREINYFKNVAKVLKKQFSNVKKVNEQMLLETKNYLTIEFDETTKRITNIGINKEKLQEVIDQSGYFVIVSNENLTPEEVLKIYKRRDNIEKTFKVLKSQCDLYKTYSTNSSIFSSKMLIGFISTIISSSIYHKTEELRSMDSNVTLPTILGELIKYIVVNEDGKIKRKYRLTSKQKRIYECFDIDENYVLKLIKKLNDQ
ncbi:IS1634 family transposase [Mycoplasma sp. NEAQ87857]|uniref:IS1634 family transposase n=1 Tax=Mycoplasma sp. NEAQ87857 TaxID=2683967 RepID=UPI00131950D0|nr:IS1634 family transposase [Mycoplasma sp. NEAQ87857]QGZ97217.1 IS1634 family transposase [Mycoplasma sp. NEAQ87857]QGZ97609.1 IS1634 family transposase [Mycoplasma sp. NEAQ87857]